MYQRILNSIARHVALTPEETQRFLSVVQHKQVRKRYFLVQAGDYCHTEYFVQAGCFRAFFTDTHGQDHNIMFAPEGWWVSDMQSYLTATPATLSVEALEDSEVLAIDKTELDKLFAEIPAFNTLFRILLQNAFVSQQQRILATISSTTEERYAAFIRKYPQLDQRIAQHHIASYLGVTPETLSRIRRQWQENRT